MIVEEKLWASRGEFQGEEGAARATIESCHFSHRESGRSSAISVV